MTSASRDPSSETARTLRWSVARLSTRLRAERSEGSGLTRLAVSVLANLHHDGPLSASQLAELEGLQPQSLTRTIHYLSGHRYVRRSRSGRDGRQQDISITDEGHVALDEHVAAGNAWLAGALDDTLTQAERDLLLIAAGLIDKLVKVKAGSSVRPTPSQDPEQPDGAAPPL